MARRLFREGAGARIAGDGPDLCRLGIEPSLLLREELWRTIGFSSLEDFLITGWEGNYLAATPTTCWR
jgi:hypothetical protein